MLIFFFSSRRRHTIFDCDWSSDVCSSDLALAHQRDVLVHVRRECVEPREPVVEVLDRLKTQRIDNEFRALHTADRKSTRLNSSHSQISYAVFCLKKKKNI